MQTESGSHSTEKETEHERASLPERNQRVPRGARLAAEGRTGARRESQSGG